MTIDQARTGDDLLTALASVKPENRSLALAARGVKILREAADLCGTDAVDMTKRACIAAINENF
jgi:hypothetical protein